MNKKAPTAARQRSMQFARDHQKAMMFQLQAAHDYVAARCLLLNGLIGCGLALGAQAIEKFLKAHLLFRDPTQRVKRLDHKLPELMTVVSQLAPELSLQQFAPVAEKFLKHYNTRYPDNPNASSAMTAGDLVELDEFVIFLNKEMPCPRNVKYRSGLYALVTTSFDKQAVVWPWERWIKEDNKALAPLLSQIAAEYAAVIEELHPTQYPGFSEMDRDY